MQNIYTLIKYINILEYWIYVGILQILKLYGYV